MFVPHAYAVLDLSKTEVGKYADFGTILKPIIPLTTIVGSLIFLFIMLWGGVTYLTAGGSEEKLLQAKKTITWAVIGLFIVLLAYLSVQLIIFSLGGSGQTIEFLNKK